jgi:hypothetical protein
MRLEGHVVAVVESIVKDWAEMRFARLMLHFVSVSLGVVGRRRHRDLRLKLARDVYHPRGFQAR